MLSLSLVCIHTSENRKKESTRAPSSGSAFSRSAMMESIFLSRIIREQSELLKTSQCYDAEKGIFNHYINLFHVDRDIYIAYIIVG